MKRSINLEYLLINSGNNIYHYLVVRILTKPSKRYEGDNRDNNNSNNNNNNNNNQNNCILIDVVITDFVVGADT